MGARRDRLAERLERAGQGHVLAFADRLDPERLDAFLGELESLDDVVGALPRGPIRAFQERDVFLDLGERPEVLRVDALSV